MTSNPAAADDTEERGSPGMGDEDSGAMNGGHIDYLDRTQDQGIRADITDGQGNVYTVSLDDLAAVGVDISDDRQLQISEEQMNNLIQMISAEDGIPEVPLKADEYEEETTGDQVTLSILNDGSIKLVTAGTGHVSYYSHSQLAEINIDSTNLSDDDIKRIVQLAGAASGEGPYEEVPEKRRKLNSSAGGQDAAARMQTTARSYQNVHVASHSAPSTSTGHAAGPSSSNSHPSARVVSSGGGAGIIANGRLLPLTGGLIGESVKIQNAKGKIVSAVVRYSIPARGYKVQYPDGKFEWVPPDKIIDRAPRPITTDPRGDYDHKGYTSEPPSSSHHNATPSTSSGGGGPLMLTRRVYAPAGGAGGPGIRAALPIRHHHHGGGSGSAPPNFCCPVCDRKVYQKEPAYIVIRLPACDACTREKILIVDEQTAGGSGGGVGGSSRSRPSTREMATDTSDLLLMAAEEDKAKDDEEKTEEAPPSTSASSREDESTTPEERPTVLPATQPTDGQPTVTPSPEGAEKEDEGEEEEPTSVEENAGTSSREVKVEPQELPLS